MDAKQAVSYTGFSRRGGGGLDPTYYFLPQRSWGKVMFLHVSVILLGGGGSAPLHAGIHTSPGPEAGTPREQTPPWDQAPPMSRPSQEQNPPPRDQAPPSAVHAGRDGQQAGGMHHTGMQSREVDPSPAPTPTLEIR